MKISSADGQVLVSADGEEQRLDTFTATERAVHLLYLARVASSQGIEWVDVEQALLPGRSVRTPIAFADAGYLFETACLIDADWALRVGAMPLSEGGEAVADLYIEHGGEG